MPYRHIVLFRVRPDVGEDRIGDLVAQLRGLADLPGVSSWRVERSLDERKGRIIVEDATFHDEAAFVAFRAHARHAHVAAHLSAVADWWVGDYRG